MSDAKPPPLPSSVPLPMPPLPMPPLAGHRAGDTGPSAIKARFVEATHGVVKRQHAEEDGEGCVTAVVVPAVVLMALTVVLLPLAVKLWRKRQAIRRYDESLREALRFAHRAEVVMAFPLMVNSMLRRPGNARAPGLFLICFEPGKGDSIAFMSDVVLRVDPDGPHANERAFRKQLMADEEFHPSRRRRLPDSLTDGAAVYAVDLAVSQLLLAGRHISDGAPWVPCVAEPGERGRAMQMPYWFVDGRPAPGEAEEGEFATILAVIGGEPSPPPPNPG